MNGHITNQQFADTDIEFIEACARAGVQPNKRRAARWRSRTGYVYGYRVGGPNCNDRPYEFLERRLLTAVVK